MLDRYPDATVHNIDRDLDALTISEELCEQLGYSGLEFAHEDITGASNVDWAAFEVVFLAALVGTDTESKIDILASLTSKLKPGALVVARSAQGLRSVLYPVRSALEHPGVNFLLTMTDTRALDESRRNRTRNSPRSASMDESRQLSRVVPRKRAVVVLQAIHISVLCISAQGGSSLLASHHHLLLSKKHIPCPPKSTKIHILAFHLHPTKLHLVATSNTPPTKNDVPAQIFAYV